jgi:hypothetical protein
MLYFPSIHFISTMNYYSKTSCVYKLCTKLLEKISQIANKAGLFLHGLKGKISSYFEKTILTDLQEKKITLLNKKREKEEASAARRFRDYYGIPPATSKHQPTLEMIPQNSKVYITDGETCPFDSIPDELIITILTYFTPGLLGTAAQVSRKFHLLANDSVLWKLKYEEEFGPGLANDSVLWKLKDEEEFGPERSLSENWKIEFRVTCLAVNRWSSICTLQDALSGKYQLKYGVFTQVCLLKYMACKKLGIPASYSKRMKLFDSGRVMKDEDNISGQKKPKVINLQMIPENMLRN